MNAQEVGERAEALFDRLRALQLPVGEYAVFGSGPLIVRGITAATGDLDILCRGTAWTTVLSLGSVVHLAEHDVTVVELDEGELSFGTVWRYGAVDVHEVIDTAEIIAGLPFARLEFVRRYKAHLGRPKDLAHLAALDAYEGAQLDRP